MTKTKLIDTLQRNPDLLDENHLDENCAEERKKLTDAHYRLMYELADKFDNCINISLHFWRLNMLAWDCWGIGQVLVNSTKKGQNISQSDCRFSSPSEMYRSLGIQNYTST